MDWREHIFCHLNISADQVESGISHYENAFYQSDFSFEFFQSDVIKKDTVHRSHQAEIHIGRNHDHSLNCPMRVHILLISNVRSDGVSSDWAVSFLHEKYQNWHAPACPSKY